MLRQREGFIKRNIKVKKSNPEQGGSSISAAQRGVKEADVRRGSIQWLGLCGSTELHICDACLQLTGSTAAAHHLLQQGRVLLLQHCCCWMGWPGATARNQTSRTTKS